MTGSREDGEDALQQTFLRAHRALLAGRAPDAVRPWLFAIARNRCRTLLATRRPAVPAEEVEVAFDGLAEDVRRRADLRELVADLGRLPEDQRGALVLHELGDLSHTEIATVIGCGPEKVKALVFQARTTLVADRDARTTPCDEIRGQLETARGGLLRRAPLRRHLRQCEPCSSYRLVVAQQRAGLAIILPVAPSAGLKAAILGGAAATTAGGGAAAGGAVAGSGAAAATSGGGAAATTVGGGGAVTSGGGAAATTVGGGAAVTSGSGAAAAGGGGAIVAGAAAVKTLTAKVVVGAVLAGAGVTGAAVTVDEREPSPVRAGQPAGDRGLAAPGRGQLPAADDHHLVAAGREPGSDDGPATAGGSPPGAGRARTVAGGAGLALRQRGVARLVRAGRRQRRITNRAGSDGRARVIRRGRRRAVRRPRIERRPGTGDEAATTTPGVATIPTTNRRRRRPAPSPEPAATSTPEPESTPEPTPEPSPAAETELAPAPEPSPDPEANPPPEPTPTPPPAPSPTPAP